MADEAYTDGAIAELGVATLRELASKDEPFFLAVGFVKPHLPFNSPKRYWELYDPAKIAIAPNPFPPRGETEYSLTTWGELRTYHDIPKTGPLSDDQARQLKHGYYAATSFTDANVGKLLDELDRLRLSGDTIVVLWGDHGWKLGEHGGLVQAHQFRKRCPRAAHHSRAAADALPAASQKRLWNSSTFIPRCAIWPAWRSPAIWKGQAPRDCWTIPN